MWFPFEHIVTLYFDFFQGTNVNKLFFQQGHLSTFVSEFKNKTAYKIISHMVSFEMKAEVQIFF